VADVYNFTGVSYFVGAKDHWLTGGLLSGGLWTVAFAALARWLRGVTNAGALTGAVSCFILFLAGGPGAFGALITVFALAWIATRFGYSRKQKLGIAERREGRNASQVIANLGIATTCAAMYVLAQGHLPGNSARGNAPWLLAMCAALSEAAADTVSSEVGQALGNRARLVTNWASVPAGTNGAVSLIGSLAGIAAAGIVSSVCLLGGLLPDRGLGISVGAAVLGMVVDSFLGASLERRQLLGNNSVNFVSTLSAALSAWLLSP